jgi:hypothetical protein
MKQLLGLALLLGMIGFSLTTFSGVVEPIAPLPGDDGLHGIGDSADPIIPGGGGDHPDPIIPANPSFGKKNT